MKIQHPKALILDQLQRAGVPSSQLHVVAAQIAEAYEDANPAELRLSTSASGEPIELPVDPFSLIPAGWPGRLPTLEELDPEDTP